MRFRYEEIYYVRTPQVGGWQCSICFTVTTARQFTDESRSVTAHGKWRWLAYLRASREAKRFARENMATNAERAAAGWAVFLCLAIASLFASPSHADYVQGAVNADGYTWTGSYWQWSDGSLWTRTYVQPYYVGHTYYPGYYSYRYVGTGQAYKVPTAGNDLSIIADAVAARDKVKSRLIERESAYKQFLEAMKAANLGGDLGQPGGGYGSQANSPLVGTFGFNTSTVYGWNQQTLAQFSNPFAVNLDQALLSYFQANQQVQDNSKLAHGLLDGTINNVVNQSAALSGISQRVAAIERLAKLADGPPVSTSSSATFKIENGKTEMLPAPKDTTLQQRWNASAQTCAKCHYGNRIEGGFSVDKFPTLAPDKQAAAIARLVLPRSDPKHMPKDADSLSAEDLRAWIEVMAQPANRQEAVKPK